MFRKVIIVKGYSENSDEQYVDNYLVNSYNYYFKSIVGGAYDDNEIIILLDPLILDLDRTISALNVEYLIIVFIGHGATQQQFQLFKLNSKQVIFPGKLNYSTKRTLVIHESCRSEVGDVLEINSSDELPIFESGGRIRTPIDRVQARNIYIQSIKNCGDGIIICYPCSLGEDAWNFYFSYGLLETSKEYHIKSDSQVYSIQVIMNYLISHLPKFTQQKNKLIQTPQIIGSGDFPFAISRF